MRAGGGGAVIFFEKVLNFEEDSEMLCPIQIQAGA